MTYLVPGREISALLWIDPSHHRMSRSFDPVFQYAKPRGSAKEYALGTALPHPVRQSEASHQMSSTNLQIGIRPKNDTHSFAPGSVRSSCEKLAWLAARPTAR